MLLTLFNFKELNLIKLFLNLYFLSINIIMFIWKLIQLKLCNKIKSSVLIVKNFVDIQGVPRNMIVNRRLKGRLRSLKILTKNLSNHSLGCLER